MSPHMKNIMIHEKAGKKLKNWFWENEQKGTQNATLTWVDQEELNLSRIRILHYWVGFYIALDKID